MSTRDDAVLTDAERQAFARLQAQAEADHHHLGIPSLWRFGPQFRAARDLVVRVASNVWVGITLMVLGVAAVAAGLVWSVALGVVGLLLVTAGAVPVVERGRARLDAAFARRSPR